MCTTCLATQSCPILCDPMDCSSPGSSVHGDSPARVLQWVAIPFSRGSSQPRDWTQVSCIAADSLPSEPPGKHKNTGVDSLSLLQGTFPTQESNQGLQDCRRIFYQLSYQESPIWDIFTLKKKKTGWGGAYFLPEIQISLGIMYFYLLTLATLPSHTLTVGPSEL